MTRTRTSFAFGGSRLSSLISQRPLGSIRTAAVVLVTLMPQPPFKVSLPRTLSLPSLFGGG